MLELFTSKMFACGTILRDYVTRYRRFIGFELLYIFSAIGQREVHIVRHNLKMNMCCSVSLVYVHISSRDRAKKKKCQQTHCRGEF